MLVYKRVTSTLFPFAFFGPARPAFSTRPAAPAMGDDGREAVGDGEREGVPKASQMQRVSW